MKYLLIVLSVFAFFTVAAQSKRITVAQDGSGNFTTVQAAFNAIPSGNKKEIIVFVKKGIYTEKLRLDSSKNFVSLIGEDKFSTILSYNDHTGKIAPSGAVINTRTSSSFLMVANDFKAENISFQNDAGFTAGQAVAVEVKGDKATFNNCRFLGFQDVLFTSSDKSRQYYKDCYIEGTTDFIFGAATVWFQHCHIHSKKDSHVTAASTPKEHAFGYVFNDCILTGDSSLHKVSLGRPWRPDAAVTYIHCFIGSHIKPEGWSNWNTTESYKTARYSEYKNYGPGATTAGRVPWSKQLSDEDVKIYTVKDIFGDWHPNL